MSKNIPAAFLKSYSKVTAVSYLFFVSFFLFRFSDGIMAYIFPIVVENSLHSNAIMGLILAGSSGIGLVCDIFFPQFFANKSWKQLLLGALVLATLFPVMTYLGELFTLAWFFVIATLIWGIYFEMMVFSEESFVVETDKARNYSRDWGFIVVLISLSEVLSPIVASLLLDNTRVPYVLVVLIFYVLAICIALLIKSKPDSEGHKVKSKTRHIYSVLKEVKIWEILGREIYSVLLVSFLIHAFFASFWVFGGLFGTELVGSEVDWIIMFLFATPGLFTALLLSRYTINERKKLWSLTLLAVGGLFLSSLVFLENNVYGIGIIIFLASSCVTMAFPLNQAVYSDLASRLGKSQKHLFGMLNSTGSLAYIIIPLVFGLVSDRYGYYVTFGAIGLMCFLGSIILFFVTPHKIRLPQKDLKKFSE